MDTIKSVFQQVNNKCSNSGVSLKKNVGTYLATTLEGIYTTPPTTTTAMSPLVLIRIFDKKVFIITRFSSHSPFSTSKFAALKATFPGFICMLMHEIHERIDVCSERQMVLVLSGSSCAAVLRGDSVGQSQTAPGWKSGPGCS